MKLLLIYIGQYRKLGGVASQSAVHNIYNRLLLFASFFQMLDSMPPSLRILLAGGSAPNSRRISGSPFSICNKSKVSFHPPQSHIKTKTKKKILTARW